MQTIVAHGGMSYSNNYDVEWVFPDVKIEGGTSLVDKLNDFNFGLESGGSTSKVGDQEGLVSGLLFGNGVQSKGMVIKYFVKKHNFQTFLQ